MGTGSIFSIEVRAAGCDTGLAARFLAGRIARPIATLVALTLVAALAPNRAAAGEVDFPIRFDHAFTRRLLVAQVFTLPGGRAQPWDDESGCGHLSVWDPHVDAAGGLLRIRMRGQAEWGVSAGDNCLFPVSWEGWIELFERPELDPRGAEYPIVRFRVTDSNIYGADGRKTLLTSRLWDWTKASIQPRMEQVAVDLRPALADLRSVLPLVLPSAYAAQADAVVASVRLAGLRVEERAMVADVAMTLPASAQSGAAVTSEPEPPLDVAEVDRFDAFLTFVLDRAARFTADDDLRAALLAVLLDSRYDIVAALAHTEPGAPDPVPRLFRSAWTRLAPTLRRLEPELPGAEALRYLSFVAAGDALATLDQLGPAAGVEISADGLRRLARIVAPEVTRDPLDYEPGVDPTLRAHFGFGPALPLPLPGTDPADDGEPTSRLRDRPARRARERARTSHSSRYGTGRDEEERHAALRSADDGPRVPAYEYACTDRPSLHRVRDDQRRASSHLLDWLVAPAYAATDTIGQIRARLVGWAPDRSNVDEYLPLARTVLRSAADTTLAAKPLGATYAPIFRPLVLATAWKETCWRQYVRRSGKVVPIESHTGAVGVMQVSPRVWRGFYDAGSLRSDILYNARAGSEILRHYLVDYAIKKGEQKKGGSVDALARATYAAYNGGPGALSRYRRTDVPSSHRKIDAEFWKLYQQVKKGNELAVRSCF